MQARIDAGFARELVGHDAAVLGLPVVLLRSSILAPAGARTDMLTGVL